MFESSIDSKYTEIRTDTNVKSKITHFSINGSTLKLEGYAYIDGLYSYSEDRIRKILILKPEVDIAGYREQMNKEDHVHELTDDEIIQLHITEIPLDNCAISNILDLHQSDEKWMESLGGFKTQIDLADLKDGRPLKKGTYNVYIKLEQLSEDNDNVKHLKIIPLANIKDFFKNNIFTTHLHYYSATRVIKYNLISSFDAYHKTLKFENTLLQSYNPKEFSDENLDRENKYLLSFKRRLLKLMYILFSILPIKTRKITFASDSRSELNGNLYFVYEELYKRNLNLDIKFIFNNQINDKKSFRYLFKTAYHFATSKVILLDDFYPLIYPLKIRKNADLIQVWHAAGAFKTFGFSRIGRPGGPSIKSRNHRNYTKATVSGEGVRSHYAEGFGITVDKVHPTGVPRSDIFFDKQYIKYVRAALFEKYPFIKGKKVILFAPTFRGNGQSSAHYPYENINFKELYDTLHEDYVFLFKMHPFIKNKLSIPYAYSDFFYDLSDFREINDLLLITDILITDYSSVCFEFALLNKPTLFFAFDVEQYIQERDFYYDFFDFIPGPLLRTTSEIVQAIQKSDFQTEKIKPFVEYFFGDTLGNASANVVDNVIIPSLKKQDEPKEIDKVNLEPPKSRLELFERSLDDNEE